MNRLSLRTRFGNWPEWGSLILLFLTFEVVIRSIEQAQWITPQPSLTLVLAFAVASGWSVSKSRLPGFIVYPLLTVSGFAVIIWQVLKLLPPVATESRVNQLLSSLQSWWQAIVISEPGESTIHFALFLILTTFIAGFISTVVLLKKRNAWLAVFLSACIILVNLSNLSKQYYGYFYLWMAAVLLLISLTGLMRQNFWFQKRGISYTTTGMKYFLVTVLSLSVLITSVVWFTPTIRVNRFENLMNIDIPWRTTVEKFVTDFFMAVPAKQVAVRSDGQGKLRFGDSSFDKGTKLNFVIKSERPSYWRIHMYDVYTSSGWINNNTTEQTTGRETIVNDAYESLKRNEMTYTVIPKLRTDIVLIAGDYIYSNIPSSVQTLTPISFSIDLSSPSDDGSLPYDVASLARSLREEQKVDKEIGINDINQLLPADLILTSADGSPYISGEADSVLDSVVDDSTPTTIEVTRITPGAINAVSVKFPRLLKAEQRYTASSSISLATADDLSEAGDDYPSWVTDFYLQLPPSLPERVLQLSETLTDDEETVYDKAVAVQHYLSTITYSQEVQAPPEEADGVDYFLHTVKSGNCINFASSLAVLLRAAGVPTRVSVGYAPGEWRESSGTSILRDKQRHAWPEVYFPRYGWIIFEATPFTDRDLEGIAFTGSGTYDEFDEEMLLEEGLDEDIIGSASTTGLEETSQNQLWLIVIIGSGLVLVIILWSVVSRRRQPSFGVDYVSDIYQRMCFLASLIKLKPEPQQTPLEYYAILASEFPLQARAFNDIVQKYMVSRFSHRKQLTYLQALSLKQSWQEIYPAFIKRLFRIG